MPVRIDGDGEITGLNNVEYQEVESNSLKLTGTTSGSSTISAPTSGTDEQFTLPAVGGELVTAPVGGQVVGYQQGMWFPTLQNATNTMTTYQSVWNRNGQLITLFGRVGFSESSNAALLQVSNLPYPVINSTQGVFLGSAMSQQNKAGKESMACYMLDTVTFYATTNRDTFENYSYDEFESNAQIVFSISYLTNDITWTPQNGATLS